jgi:hypothetical protein
MISALFWDITQRLVVFLYGRFGITYKSHLQGSRGPQPIGPIFKDQDVQDFLTLEDGTNKLSRNVGTELPLNAA